MDLPQVKFSTVLASEFSVAVRKRGAAYYEQGLVLIDEGDGSHVKARVRGSRVYHVELIWQESRLRMECDCISFLDYGPCKHLWATVLAAEKGGYLSALVSAGKSISLYDPIDDEDDLEDDDDEDSFDSEPMLPVNRRAEALQQPGVPVWRRQIESIANSRAQSASPKEPWPAKRQILYHVDGPGSANAGGLILQLQSRDLKADGTFGRASPVKLSRDGVRQLPDQEDREIISLLLGSVGYYGWGSSFNYQAVSASNLLTDSLAAMIVPRAVATGRCYSTDVLKTDRIQPLTWDAGDPWHFVLQMKRKSRGGWTVGGLLRRGEEELDVMSPAVISNGFVITNLLAARLANDTPEGWIASLRKEGSIEAPPEAAHELLGELLRAPSALTLEVPEELRYEEVTAVPRFVLRVRRVDNAPSHAPPRVSAELSFDYDGKLVSSAERGSGVYETATRRFFRRDSQKEEQAVGLLRELSFKLQDWSRPNQTPAWELAAGKLPRAVRRLVGEGWHVEAEGRLFRKPGEFRMQVSSGVDWFELHGQVEYGDTVARLPELLEALRRGETTVQLGDGTYGLVPEDWLKRIGVIAGMGAPKNGHIEFRRSQAGLLDALLATQPETSCDETFARFRSELQTFAGIVPAAQPEGFVGQLREYQREGLSWMQFLQRFSFGGCLADDMGVGKTAQVLALLEARRANRQSGETRRPSLVVVPKSIVFNWREEAARFTPQLTLLEYTGLERGEASFDNVDVVLTTYGILRQDAPRLKDIEFDYLILDEAQAIKNAATESAKAVRLLRGNHRLALSGTPVENHLGELFSIFEFLNPGMLGTASILKIAGSTMRDPDKESRELLSRALRPFILRRTKEQVVRELPPKTEQTIVCEMSAGQRKLYDELRQHYRDSLLGRVATQGLAKSKILILEALLRLRQAACHPGLIDTKRSGEGSAKLDLLLDRLREVLDE